MISAAEARELENNISQVQLEQIERGIKETILMGGHCIYYKTEKLNTATVEYLKSLGYKMRIRDLWTSTDTEISWEA